MPTDVQGYASVFGNLDSYDEIVDPGAFADWQTDNPGKQVPLLWMHDRRKLPLGMTTALSEDSFGLRFAGEIDDTELGADVVKLIGSAAVRSSSFAYWTRGWEKRDDEWHLTQLDLIEVSAVTTGFGANDEAFIELAPAEDEEPKAIQQPAPGLSAADINAIFAKHWRLNHG